MRIAIALFATASLVGVAAPVPIGSHASRHSERLAARARRGDRVARTALVEGHMGMVRAVAFRYRNLGLPVEDLVQEGAIGLLTAVDDYDAARGASFATYAFWRVRAAVTHAVTARGNLIRVPRPVLEQRRRVAAARQALASSGREPGMRDLTAATSLPAAAVAEALAPATVVSLDATSANTPTLAERLPDDPSTRPEALAITAVERRAVRRALQRLRPRKRTILMRHFGIDGEPETLSAIATDLRLSPERTRALKNEALRELASDLAGVA